MTQPLDIPRLPALIDNHGPPTSEASFGDRTDDGTPIDSTVSDALHELAAASANRTQQARQLIALLLDDSAQRIDRVRTAVRHHSLSGERRPVR